MTDKWIQNGRVMVIAFDPKSGFGGFEFMRCEKSFSFRQWLLMMGEMVYADAFRDSEGVCMFTIMFVDVEVENDTGILASKLTDILDEVRPWDSGIQVYKIK